MLKYIMDCIRPLPFQTQWMSKRYTVTLHYITTLYNNIADHMDAVILAFAQKKTQWKEDLYFPVKLAHQNLSQKYAEVTPKTGMLLIEAHIFDPVQKFLLFRKWDMEMDIIPEDETSYITQYHDAFLQYGENG